MTVSLPSQETSGGASERRPYDGYGSQGSSYEREGLPPYLAPLSPLVSAAARMNASVHIKLLSGFLIGAMLLLGMAVLSFIVINRMSQRVVDLNRLQQNVDRARDMYYLVTAQSHYRAMALLTNDNAQNQKIILAKRDFAKFLDELERTSQGRHVELFSQVREADRLFAESSDKALALYQAGKIDEALAVHINEEHPVSHVLEDAMVRLVGNVNQEIADAKASIRSDRQLLMGTVGAFSVISLVSAMLLGMVLSWSFIKPVRKINNVLMRIADGDFTQRVEVPNRDEFGTLSLNLNRTTEHLSDLYDKLRLELAEGERLTQTLEHRSAELAAINSELESFSYSVSHDLQAPLRSIDGFSLALLEDYSSQLDDQGQDYLHRVRAASQRMAQLINDLLNLSRVTRSEISRETVDLSSLARKIASELQDKEPERQVTFTIAEDVVSNGDGRLLRIVLENLLGNAWKYTAMRPHASIEFGAVHKDGRKAYFVRDDGAGFDMAYASKLFVPFQRLHPASEYEGTGIGLPTVQRIINRHGGRVWAEGEVGKGATFYFTLS